MKPKKELKNLQFFLHKMTRQSMKLGKFMTNQVANMFGHVWWLNALFQPLKKHKNGEKIISAKLVARGFKDDLSQFWIVSPTLSRQSFQLLWWWLTVFVVWLTDERHLALLPAKTIVKDFHHPKSQTCCKQDLNFHRTWVQA